MSNSKLYYLSIAHLYAIIKQNRSNNLAKIPESLK